MLRRVWFVGILALLVGASVAVAKDKETKPPPDLSGAWRFDPEHSDTPGMGGGGGGGWGGGGGMGGGYGHHGGGGHGGGMGGPPEGGGGPPDGGGPGGGGEGRARPPRMPALIRIDRTGDVLRIADSTGVVLSAIRVGDSEPDTTNGVPEVRGKWKGDHLEVERETPRGTVTTVYSLADQGKTLLVETRLPAGGPAPARTVRRVYRREATS